MVIETTDDALIFLSWLERANREPVRQTINVDDDTLSLIRQKLKQSPGEALVVVTAIAARLTGPARKSAQSALRVARYRQRRREQYSPVAMTLPAHIYRRARQKSDQLGLDIPTYINYLMSHSNKME